MGRKPFADAVCALRPRARIGGHHAAEANSRYVGKCERTEE